MKCLAISYKGMEDITSLEIKELLGIESEVKESCVLFECEEEKLAEYCYKAQGVNRVLVLLDEFKISKIEDLERVSKIDFSKWLKGKTFAARCSVFENDFNKAEIERTTGDFIDYKVDLKNPDVTIFVYIYLDKCYIGIDFSGDLSKRDYKIFTCRDDLKGTIAYALVRLSGYSNDKSFLNSNAKSGTIAIEAALFGSGLSVNYFNKEKFNFLKFFKIDLSKFDEENKNIEVYANDSDSYLRSVSKNAKIAGIKLKFDFVKADCVVDYSRGEAKIRNLAKEREIKYGKSSLKIVTLRN